MTLLVYCATSDHLRHNLGYQSGQAIPKLCVRGRGILVWAGYPEGGPYTAIMESRFVAIAALLGPSVAISDHHIRGRDSSRGGQT